jgi:predicted transglutaminase-like cysteine proteinase
MPRSGVLGAFSVRILALCLLAAACASPVGIAPRVGDQTEYLLSGASVTPPEGLLDYCARTPSDCGGAAPNDLRGLMPATGAASFQQAAWTSGNAVDGAVFRAMLAARMAPTGLEAAPSASRVEMSLSPERLRELIAVNRDINRRIRPTTDEALYGVEEYWNRPLSQSAGGEARGDCEDYALEKRARLIELGWPPAALAMAIAVAPYVGLHATLIAQTDRGDFVLDNLNGRPRPLAELDYVWISRQVGADLTHWAAARPSAGPARLPATVDASAEDMFRRLLAERAGQAQRVHDDAPASPLPAAPQAPESPAPPPAPPRVVISAEVAVRDRSITGVTYFGVNERSGGYCLRP